MGKHQWEHTPHEIFILGAAFKTLAEAIEDSTGVKVSPTKIDAAARFPSSELASMAAPIVRHRFKLDKARKRCVNAALDIIDQDELGGRSPLTPTQQSSWWLGYSSGWGVMLPIQHLRERRDPPMSAVELAESIGVSRQLLSRWESYKVMPAAESVEKLATALNVSPEEMQSRLKMAVELRAGTEKSEKQGEED